MNLKEKVVTGCHDLKEGTKKQASYYSKYIGYSLWWGSARLLEYSLDKIKRKTQDMHIWSVQAANDIWAKRERLGQEKEAASDHRSHVIPGHDKPEEFVEAEEALITARVPPESEPGCGFDTTSTSKVE